MRKLLIIFLTVFSASVFPKSAHDIQSRVVQSDLYQLVAKIRQQYHVNAMTLAVQSPDMKNAIVIGQGTRQENEKQTIDDNTLYQVGSITKTFTAFLMYQAILNHQISMSDTLAHFFPQYVKWKNVTIGDLINQTSGIPDYDHSKNWIKRLVYHPTRIWTSSELVNIAYQMPLKFKNGAGWAYSNTNYVLLGMILEKIRHQSDAKLMQSLFSEAHLNNTYYFTDNLSTALMKKMAYGYYQSYDQTKINTSWLQTAGGITSNPGELVKWYHYLFEQGLFSSKNHSMFVSTSNGLSTINRAQTGYAFGVFQLNTPEGFIYFTPGLTPGYTSIVGYDPCHDIYFSYSASRGSLPHDFHKIMLEKLLPILKNLNTKPLQLGFCAKIKPAKKFTFPKI